MLGTLRTIAGALGIAMTMAACRNETAPPSSPPPAPAPTIAAAPAPTPAVVSVSNIALGSVAGVNTREVKSTVTFAKNDTVYVAIDTIGSGKAALKVRLIHLTGETKTLVREDSVSIAPTGPTSTKFTISMPHGWLPGDYRLEIILNNKSVGLKTFAVN